MESKKVKLEQNFNSLIFLGDIHGDYHNISHFLHSFDLHNVLIYQVGDFEIGFREKQEKSKLITLNEILFERNSKVVAIRGNHDSPLHFEKDRYEFSNIHFLSDYTILTVIVDGIEKNILGIGGAVSIDRKIKAAQKAWFVGEPVNCTTDMSFLNLLKDIHIIITHTSPDFVPPFIFNSLVETFASNDRTLKFDLIQERQKLSNMIDYLIGVNKETLTHYFYGHFHKSMKDEYKGINFQCLAINEFKEFKIE